MNWNKTSAEDFVYREIADKKIIILDGTATLKKLSAIDYLVKEHGYILVERRKI